MNTPPVYCGALVVNVNIKIKYNTFRTNAKDGQRGTRRKFGLIFHPLSVGLVQI